jgi:phenylpyruvate tautomerase
MTNRNQGTTMPYLKIQTNKALNDSTKTELLKKASAAVATGLGKSESYVMVAFEPTLPMVFAGSDDPCTYLELKSIGLSESKTAALSEMLCELMETELGIPASRTYVEFVDAPRAMWGWNRRTF